MAHERDTSLRYLERNAAVACIIMAIVALVLQRGRPDGAIGVLGGGALMAFSYRAIRGGVDAVLRGSSPVMADTTPAAGMAPRAGTRWGVVLFLVRYAVMGVVAWVLLVKAGAHPLGLFAGVSAPVLALGFEAVRIVSAKPDSRR